MVDKMSPRDLVLPELVVFDLDMCLWSPEMYTLSEVPSSQDMVIGSLGDYGDGVISVRSGRDEIQLFPAALSVLQKVYKGQYPGVRLAAASSADTPHAVKIGRTALGMLEVVPGVTVREVFAQGWPEGFEGNLQIGRTAPLSSNKAATHFPFIKKATLIDYDKMLFFDDCNWGDNCGNVERHCNGVTTQRTPGGLQWEEWELGLKKYARGFIRGK
jgi:magnesium-dependent phosphatase 1